MKASKLPRASGRKGSLKSWALKWLGLGWQNFPLNNAVLIQAASYYKPKKNIEQRAKVSSKQSQASKAAFCTEGDGQTKDSLKLSIEPFKFNKANQRSRLRAPASASHQWPVAKQFKPDSRNEKDCATKTAFRCSYLVGKRWANGSTQSICLPLWEIGASQNVDPTESGKWSLSL